MSDCPNQIICCPGSVFDSAPAPAPPQVTYWNSEQSATAECPVDSVGGPFTYTVPPDTYSSTVSQLDADNKAMAAAVAGAEAMRSQCVPPPDAVTYWNVEKTATAYCEYSEDGGPFTATVAAHTYSSLISQLDADNQAQTAAQAAADAQLSGCSQHINTDLSGLLWAMPCEDNNIGCACHDPADQNVTLSGEAGHLYTVSLRFRGVVELFNYGDGTPGASPLVRIDSTPPVGYVGNVYTLETSNPPHIYYLNNLWHSNAFTEIIDYIQSIQMVGGSTVTLRARSGDNIEVASAGVYVPDDDPAHPIRVSQPYHGQFIQMDVLSVTY